MALFRSAGRYAAELDQYRGRADELASRIAGARETLAQRQAALTAAISGAASADDILNTQQAVRSAETELDLLRAQDELLTGHVRRLEAERRAKEDAGSWARVEKLLARRATLAPEIEQAALRLASLIEDAVGLGRDIYDAAPRKSRGAFNETRLSRPHVENAVRVAMARAGIRWAVSEGPGSILRQPTIGEAFAVAADEVLSQRGSE